MTNNNKRKNKSSYFRKNKSSKKHPHDIFFRSIFSTTKRIERLLKTILSKDILGLFDLSSLKIEPSVVVKRLEIRADLVLSILLKNSKKEAKVIFILDHKSWPDKDVIQQLQKYQLMIVNEFSRGKVKSLSPVLCIIFYHGDKEWKRPSSLHEDWISRGLFSKNEMSRLAPYLMNFRPYIFDLSKFDIAKQAMDSMKSILYAFEDIWSLKHCKTRKEKKKYLHKILVSVKKDLKNESKQYRIDVLLAIKQYFMDYDSQIDEILFKEASKEVTEELGGENIMGDLDYTMAAVVRKKVQEEVQKKLQKGRKESRKEGRMEGREEGRMEGREEGRREITLRLLNADMSVEKVSEITGLSKQEIYKFQEDTKK